MLLLPHLWCNKPFRWFRFPPEPFVWTSRGITPSYKMLMRAKFAGFLLFSLMKDARGKPVINSYALQVILTPSLLNSFSLPFFPKKSILGNVIPTIFLIFLLSLRTPETWLLEGIVFEVTHFIKSNMWPF